MNNRYENQDRNAIWDSVTGYADKEDFMIDGIADLTGIDAYLDEMANMFGIDETLTTEERETVKSAMVKVVEQHIEECNETDGMQSCETCAHWGIDECAGMSIGERFCSALGCPMGGNMGVSCDEYEI